MTGSSSSPSASLADRLLIALSRDNLKARLAYSTISQLAYIMLGAALATADQHHRQRPADRHARRRQDHLFFCAGAIYTRPHRAKSASMTGIGRKMPVTLLALLGRLPQHHRPAAAGRRLEQMDPGARRARFGPYSGRRRADAQFADQCRLFVADRGARLLFAAAGRQAGEAVAVEEAPLACLIALCCTRIASASSCFSRRVGSNAAGGDFAYRR